ncbi:MAG: hypothetical protein JWM91_312 [Rhodospirillales bacterium]|nr:hypothetical protein [Rhodospirillales bacterium]
MALFLASDDSISMTGSDRAWRGVFLGVRPSLRIMAAASWMQADHASLSLYFCCEYGRRLPLRPVMVPLIVTGNLLLQNRYPAAMSVAALITLLNVLVASGFSIASLVRPELIVPAGTTPSDASAIFAMYAAARSLPLAGAVILAIAMRSPAALLVLGSLVGVIQCLDAIIGVLHRDVAKTIGPLVLACLQAYAMLRLRKET